MDDHGNIEVLLQVSHAIEEAVKEAVRLAVRNALTEATAGLEQRIIDGLAYPRIQTRKEPDGSRSVIITFKADRNG